MASIEFTNTIERERLRLLPFFLDRFFWGLRLGQLLYRFDGPVLEPAFDSYEELLQAFFRLGDCLESARLLPLYLYGSCTAAAPERLAAVGAADDYARDPGEAFDLLDCLQALFGGALMAAAGWHFREA